MFVLLTSNIQRSLYLAEYEILTARPNYGECPFLGRDIFRRNGTTLGAPWHRLFRFGPPDRTIFSALKNWPGTAPNYRALAPVLFRRVPVKHGPINRVTVLPEDGGRPWQFGTVGHLPRLASRKTID
jgi:hypothetical protein